jgi:hypothetical protein
MTNDPRSAKRVDDLGRAFAGSQLQLQIYANRRAGEINDSIGRAIGLDATSFEWVSPREDAAFREYRDSEFLRRLGYDNLLAELRTFWPARGPRWDGLLRCGRSIILVEAKSYPGEVRGRGCMAGDRLDSRNRIISALAETATYLRVPMSDVWLGSLYQYANRLANAAFLRRQGIDAFLCNVCFTDDPNPGRRTSVVQWRQSIVDLKTEIGFAAAAPSWLADVILPSRPRDELLVSHAT